jgi:hypothetical protein
MTCKTFFPPLRRCAVAPYLVTGWVEAWNKISQSTTLRSSACTTFFTPL